MQNNPQSNNNTKSRVINYKIAESLIISQQQHVIGR